ncbi:serine-rich coiled-coil domain-containing protein 2 isoform X1 [Lepisosteus oculatus]|uniref:serine-rich coiled-coil domain-containing protein 2 isoform X1 n=1 Tax=Lepisosteus oculatus TaxID=7918 RepID=UPI00371A37FB
MEEKALSKPSMVSRLPKFGVRPPGSSLLPNGSGSDQRNSAPEGKGCPAARQNGVVRMSSFSLKWKKGSGTSGCLTSPEENADSVEKVEEGGSGRLQQQQLVPVREIKKPSAPNIKLRKTTGASTAPKPVSQASSAGSRGGSIAGRPLSGQNFYSSKAGLNGLGNGSTSRFGSGLQRPRANSGSARSSSRESLTQSSDSLKSLCLDNIVRSQSFSHFKQLPSPPSLSMTRSYSFNKAVELAKPLANPQLHNKTKPTTSAPVLPNGRGGGGGGPARAPLTRPVGNSSTAPSHGALKKPLLPNCMLGKPSVLSYRKTRPSLVKPSRPVLAGKVGVETVAVEGQGESGVGKGNLEEPSPTTPEAKDPKDTERPEFLDRLEEGTAYTLREQESNMRYLGEGLEDMSLSSTSSLERNDTSEEYLDDFDNLGNGGGMLLLPASVEGLLQSQPEMDDNVPGNREDGTPTQTHLSGFLSDGMDWVEVGLPGTGSEEGYGLLEGPNAPFSLSPEGDFPAGSSLELSPSDSSGGTYMWDEEGMGDPLGPATHPCGSYDDSDINSMDILNNLDNLDSCDLEDDDLMLDVELPDDGSLNSGDADGMSQLDRSERGGRQGHWRRRQHRWSGPDHFHSDTRGAGFLGSTTGPFEGYGSSGSSRAAPRPLQPLGWQENTVMLDELTLRHMAQDCTSVKTQLLKLRRLLQMGDGGTVQDSHLSGASSPDPLEDSRVPLQVEELMKEVQQLKEELKSKDQTIEQLRQQASVLAQPARCHCQHRVPEVKTERRTHQDKATQTPWRGNAPQILQPSSRYRTELLAQGRLAKTAPTEDHSDRAEPAGAEEQPSSHSGPDASADTINPAAATAVDLPAPAPDPDEHSPVLSTRLKVSSAMSSAAKPGPTGTALLPGPPRGPLTTTASAPQRIHGNGPPRILQPPRFYTRVSVPALPQEGMCGTAGSLQEGSKATSRLLAPYSSANLKVKQHPPPSQGTQALSAAQAIGHSRPLGRRDIAAQQDQEKGVLKARDLLPTNHSRLPKPKIH